jgi:hypothetical protein
MNRSPRFHRLILPFDRLLLPCLSLGKLMPFCLQYLELPCSRTSHVSNCFKDTSDSLE